MNSKLKILLISSFFFTLASGLLNPFYAVFVKEIGGDLLLAGSTYSVFLILSGVLIYFLSRWEDHVKHQEKLIIGAKFLAMLGFFGFLLVKNPWHLFIVQIIQGISFALEAPAFDSVYSKNLSKGKFASQWGIWESVYSITLGFAALIGGVIAHFYGFKILLIGMFLFSVLSFLASILLIRK